ncbi:MAG: hypothetical protein ABIE03_02475 [Patescibacteria group bacterium]|nr:hypothetical protein [Patescibacteria group bacterium]
MEAEQETELNLISTLEIPPEATFKFNYSGGKNYDLTGWGRACHLPDGRLVSFYSAEDGKRYYGPGSHYFSLSKEEYIELRAQEEASLNSLFAQYHMEKLGI